MLRVLRPARLPVPSRRPRVLPLALLLHPNPAAHQRRAFMNIPTALVPPIVFSGLVLALWTWKCAMMVLFQNKIIYMPFLPPGARRETIKAYERQCGGVIWREERTRASDGTQISLCVASANATRLDKISGEENEKRVYVLYFQGNASSLPPRLPFLSPVVKLLGKQAKAGETYVMVCCSYRGYWTSSGRPSEGGLALDAEASLRWIQEQEEARQARRETDLRELASVVIWGQSIGAGVATRLASQQKLFSPRLPLKTLILETPFLSVREMLLEMYPQKWLPYRYLGPFLWTHLDSLKALGDLSGSSKDHSMQTPKVVILQAGKDELVSRYHGEALEKRCAGLGVYVERQVIQAAFHTEILSHVEGRLAVVTAVMESGRHG